VNCLDGMARTPLHIVSEAGNPEAVQLLINSGAQVRIRLDLTPNVF
jgi:ankyrin repeat protein